MPFPPKAQVYSRSLRKEGLILREVTPGWYEVFFSARERSRLPAHDLELLSDADPLLDRLLQDDLDRPAEFDLANMAMTLHIAHHHDPYVTGHAKISISGQLNPAPNWNVAARIICPVMLGSVRLCRSENIKERKSWRGRTPLLFCVGERA